MCCYGIPGERVLQKGKKVIGEVFIRSFLLKFAAVFPVSQISSENDGMTRDYRRNEIFKNR